MSRVLALLGLPLLLAACSLTPVASRVPGYLTTPRGTLLQDADGRCWRTADWRPALAVAECDPEVVQAREEEQAKAEEAKPEEKPKPEDAKPEQAAEEVAAEPAAEDAAPEATAASDEAPATDAPAADTAVTEAPTVARQAAAAALAASLGEAPAPAAATGAPATATVAKREPRFRDETVFEPVTLNSDTSFFFGDDHLTPEGRRAVTEIAGLLKARRAVDLKITVVGHTDRVGSAAANLALSRRRAQAVKAALVAEGLPAAAIDAVGLGATRPVTAREDCPDRLVKCELIACLKPDRRVEIQARGRLPSGTRRVPLEGLRQPLRLPRAASETAEPVVCRAG